MIRPGRLDDLAALTEIYNHYVLTSPATFDLEPFEVDQRLDWFGHYAQSGPHRLLVAAGDAGPLGYATSGRWRPKPAYETTVETTVYLRPEATGQGVGQELYAALFAELAGEDVRRAVAGIVPPNDASIRLHRQFGFREVGRFTEVGRKFGRYWDVLWFEKTLPA
ncbi:MAG TPA: GNAT family N-acetyltransferase [Candidatus Dormibacteraeota bacterium]